jgi:hypothetical protein
MIDIFIFLRQPLQAGEFDEASLKEAIAKAVESLVAPPPPP